MKQATFNQFTLFLFDSFFANEFIRILFVKRCITREHKDEVVNVVNLRNNNNVKKITSIEKTRKKSPQ